LVLLGVVVGQFVAPVTWLARAVGFGPAFSAATNTCTMGILLAKLAYNRGPRCNIEQVLADLHAEVVL
jgi:hypothetical protein